MSIVINIVLKALILLGLNWLGWIRLHGTSMQGNVPPQIPTALIVAMIFTAVSFAVWFILAFGALMTFGLSIFLYILLMPFYGWLILSIVHWVSPDYLGLSDNFWLVAFSGFLVAAVSLPDGSGSEAKVKVSRR